MRENYPEPTDETEPAALNQLDRIRAHGEYRRVLDASAENVAQMTGDDAALDPFERYETMIAVRSVREAKRVLDVIDYTRRGDYLDDGPQTDALDRVEDAVTEQLRRLRAGADAVLGDDREGGDAGPTAVTDGGTRVRTPRDCVVEVPAPDAPEAPEVPTSPTPGAEPPADDAATRDAARRTRAWLRASSVRADQTARVETSKVNPWAYVETAEGNGSFYTHPAPPERFGLIFRGVKPDGRAILCREEDL